MNRNRTAVVDAEDVRDLIRAMKTDVPSVITLLDGSMIELVGGDPATEEIGPEYSGAGDLPEI
jgi:hypothetical protein